MTKTTESVQPETNKEILENYGIVASFDTTKPQGKLQVINAKNGAGVSLKDLATGTSFVITGALQYKELIDNYGSETESVVSAMIGEDGLVYSSVSPTVGDVVIDLIELLKDETVKTLTITVIKRESKGGREFLSLTVTA